MRNTNHRIKRNYNIRNDTRVSLNSVSRTRQTDVMRCPTGFASRSELFRQNIVETSISDTYVDKEKHRHRSVSMKRTFRERMCFFVVVSE